MTAINNIKPREMNASLQKNKSLRKCWDEWLLRTKTTQREVAEMARVDQAALSRAIKNGIAPETMRSQLLVAGVPAELLPLPSNPFVLLGIIHEQQQKIIMLQQKN